MGKNKNFALYRARVNQAVSNEFLRTAMDRFAVAYRQSRINAFAGMNVSESIKEVAAIRSGAVRNNAGLVNLFCNAARKKGVKVHMASDALDAGRIIAEIAGKAGVKSIIKSKSMTAEEINLNLQLENRGLEITETDLGEWIVQLKKEKPSHMVMPAIHLSRYQVADLFSGVTGSVQDSQIEHLVRVARRQLREKFVLADMGISGANFLLADSGIVGIVTNEGNARLVTTLPRVHVVLAGIDKVLPSLEQALSVNAVLPRNATGQAITSYLTWITGPGEYRPGSGDSEKQMHVVLLDNGRSAIAKDPVFSQALQCIRCGACANVCPVYRVVGGHVMGHIYIGAIGLVFTYLFHGTDAAENLVRNCTNCGACRDVCAAGIDLPCLINEVHSRIQDEKGHSLQSVMLARVLKNRKLFHSLLRAAGLASRPLARKGQYLRHLPLIFSKDHNYKALPVIAETPFRQRFEKIYRPVKKPLCKIALFAGCAQDFVYPEHLEAAMDLFAKAGIRVEFPQGQSCCGLPLAMTGEKKAAQDVALQNIDAFSHLDIDYIVTLCASCASYLANNYAELVHQSAQDMAAEFAGRVIVFSRFVNDVIGTRYIKVSAKSEKTAFHFPCHLCRDPESENAPVHLIRASGNTWLSTDEQKTCCGFAGSYSARFPLVSKQILDKKLKDVEKSGAEVWATECPGCVMQLQGGAVHRNLDIKVVHLSQILV